MARNLRKFATLAAYQSAELIKPAVSLIEATDGVYFDQKEPPFGGLTVKYSIEDPTVEVTLFNGGGDSSSSSESASESGGGGALPATMIVDGAEETPINTWRFETAGEHIVQYTFADNIVPQGFLDSIPNVTTIEIGTDITRIDENAFNYAGVNISIEQIICYSVDTPYLSTGAFTNTMDCPIYVPALAVDVYKESTATGWSDYASRIQAIQ